MEPGPSYGIYDKKGWRSWHNTEQEGIASPLSKESEIGRRYDSSDNTCKLRNVLLTVLSNTEDAQLLIELKSTKFSAIYLKNIIYTAVATIGIVMASV
jgi:hypothetical protein